MMKQLTNLKRVIDAILLTIVMALTLTACGITQASGAVTSEGAKKTGISCKDEFTVTGETIQIKGSEESKPLV